MYKRHFIFALICLLIFTVGSQPVSAQSQLAQDTYAIFEASCLNCHGPDGAFRETLLMEYSEIIDGGSVVPGKSQCLRVVQTPAWPHRNGAQMPFGLPQLPAQSIETIRRWILEAPPIGRQPARRSVGSSLPAKPSRALRHTLTRSRRLTAPSHDTLR